MKTPTMTTDFEAQNCLQKISRVFNRRQSRLQSAVLGMAQNKTLV